jgi:uncharacterized DUF497 family protein
MAVFDYDPWLQEFIEAGQFVFEWDRGNRTKNWIRHGIKTRECEEVFLSGGALPIGIQVNPPVNENRYAVIGETSSRRPLFVVFTLRAGKVRIISARLMTGQEREDYDLLR